MVTPNLINIFTHVLLNMTNAITQGRPGGGSPIYVPSFPSSTGSLSPSQSPSQSANLVEKIDCGVAVKPGTFGTKIVGGRKSNLYEFPWQVSLQRKKPDLLFVSPGYSHFCGATVLNQRWILTAAHCTNKQSVSRLRAVVGTNNIARPGKDAVTVYFDKVVQHPSYNEYTVENDIALIHTKTNIPLYPQTNSVNAACLPTKSQRFDGLATVTGWGALFEGGTIPDELMAVDLKLIGDDACQNAYSSSYKPPKMMCGGYLEGGKDSCQGDSGGPLVKKVDDKSFVIGVVSFGRGCARKGYPGIYTQVSEYIDWINKYIST